MFNPLKYQYLATFLNKDESHGELRLQMGATEEIVNLPLCLLPDEVAVGEQFILKLQPTETAKDGEYETMRKILEELIN